MKKVKIISRTSQLSLSTGDRPGSNLDINMCKFLIFARVLNLSKL